MGRTLNVDLWSPHLFGHLYLYIHMDISTDTCIYNVYTPTHMHTCIAPYDQAVQYLYLYSDVSKCSAW